jgi:hypothetical protein
MISQIKKRSRYLMNYEVFAVARALKVSLAWLFAESADEA